MIPNAGIENAMGSIKKDSVISFPWDMTKNPSFQSIHSIGIHWLGSPEHLQHDTP